MGLEEALMEVDEVRSLCASLPGRLDRARRVFGRPLTLTERILVTHTATVAWKESKRCTP